MPEVREIPWEEVHRIAGAIASVAEDVGAGIRDEDLAARERLIHLAGEITERLLGIEAAVSGLARERASERERNRDQAERAAALEKELESLSNWAKLGKLAAEIGSDVKNTLAMVSARCEVMRLLAERGQGDKLAAGFAALGPEIQKAQQLVVDLVDLSRESSERRPIDLNVAALEAVRFASSLSRFDNIRFSPDLEEGLPPVHADLGQLQQLLVNLFTNAADAMGRRKGEGGSVWITTAHLPAERCVEMSVRDEGPGVLQEFRDRIYEAGFSTREGRRGLGLAVAHHIVTTHGGTIALAPAQARGAEFRIRFPLPAQRPPEQV